MVTLPTHQQSFSTRGTALTRDARGDRIADGGAAGTGHLRASPARAYPNRRTPIDGSRSGSSLSSHTKRPSLVTIVSATRLSQPSGQPGVLPARSPAAHHPQGRRLGKRSSTVRPGPQSGGKASLGSRLDGGAALRVEVAAALIGGQLAGDSAPQPAR